VVRVECPARAIALTGFKGQANGMIGIVTALHGVVGCPDLLAYNLQDSYRGLRISAVDIPNDAAFLTSAELQSERGEPLTAASGYRGEDLRVVGYPQALTYQLSHRVETHLTPLRFLEEILPADVRNDLASRGSPEVDQEVFSLAAAIQEGHSGAPILSWGGEVVGIADGGLRSGTVDVGWAIPVWNLHWQDPNALSSVLAGLGGSSPTPLFGAAARPISEVPPFLLVDGGDSVGKIYLVHDGAVTQVYSRGRGRIYSVAKGPDGIYFSDHNDSKIFKIFNGQEALVYTHDTYSRDIAFDSEGRLYFSESSGAGGDGTIYRINPGERFASPFFTVRLSDVDGFWAGNFAFAPDDRLWLSSGNRVPASLYQVNGDRPRRMYNSAGSISGFTFTADGDILYADWRQRVFRIELPGFAVSQVTHAPTVKWASDVAVE
jgi:hypothetical protein